jgi:hypothetical protein
LICFSPLNLAFAMLYTKDWQNYEREREREEISLEMDFYFSIFSFSFSLIARLLSQCPRSNSEWTPLSINLLKICKISPKLDGGLFNFFGGSVQFAFHCILLNLMIYDLLTRVMICNCISIFLLADLNLDVSFFFFFEKKNLNGLKFISDNGVIYCSITKIWWNLNFLPTNFIGSLW